MSRSDTPAVAERVVARVRIILALVLMSMIAGLGALLTWEWDQARALERDFMRYRRVPHTPVPPLTLAPEFTLPDPQSGFPELLARPLFWASRRPLAPLGSASAGSFKKGQVLLVGVVVSPAWRGALLRDIETGRIERVAEGGVFRGLTLAEVGPDRAVLRLGAEAEELRLIVQRGGAGVVQPLAAAPAPAPANAPLANISVGNNSAAASPAQPAASAAQPVVAVRPTAPASQTATPFPSPPHGTAAPIAR